jgi:hypothetical protein
MDLSLFFWGHLYIIHTNHTLLRGRNLLKKGYKDFPSRINNIPGDSDWYSRPYIFFVLRKKYSKPYNG